MSVRERIWKTRNGEEKKAWQVDYRDQRGRRLHRSFRTKNAAKDFAASSRIEVKEGTHVPDSRSVTVTQAGELWIKSAENNELERTTVDQYRQHLDLHIKPFIGGTKLSGLSVPFIRAFEDRLQEPDENGKTRSRTMAKYVVRSLGMLLADAQDRGLIVRNPVHERRRQRQNKTGSKERRGKQFKVEIDTPAPDEIRSIVHTAEGRWRPLLLTAIFTGLRASELRGLTWENVDLKNAKLHVRQRADRLNRIGPPKSTAGERTVPLPPMVVAELRNWKLVCPKKDDRLWLVFPNSEGNVQYLRNIVLRGLQPTLVAAGVTKPVLDAQGRPRRDEDGKPVVEPKYSGMHALRHFYASWCASIGLSMKVVQVRMGHSDIKVTMDTYTHLFPDTSEDAEKLANAESALLGAN